jgi:hypothetical protein
VFDCLCLFYLGCYFYFLLFLVLLSTSTTFGNMFCGLLFLFTYHLKSCPLSYDVVYYGKVEYFFTMIHIRSMMRCCNSSNSYHVAYCFSTSFSILFISHPFITTPCLLGTQPAMVKVIKS